MGDIINLPYKTMAEQKLNEEFKSFKGDMKAKAVSEAVKSTIIGFAKQNDKFAQYVYLTKRTLSDVVYEIMKDVKNSISDIDLYRRAVTNYCPGSEVRMLMEVDMSDCDYVSEEELNRETKYPKKAEPKPYVPTATTTPYVHKTAEELKAEAEARELKAKEDKLKKQLEDSGQVFLFDL